MKTENNNNEFNAWFAENANTSEDSENLEKIQIDRETLYEKRFYGMGTYTQKTGAGEGNTSFFFKVSHKDAEEANEIIHLTGMSGKSAFESLARQNGLTEINLIEPNQKIEFENSILAKFGIGQQTSKAGRNYYVARLNYGGAV